MASKMSCYRGTSRIRNSAPLRPYSRNKVVSGSGLFLMSEVPLHSQKSHRLSSALHRSVLRALSRPLPSPLHPTVVPCPCFQKCHPLNCALHSMMKCRDFTRLSCVVPPALPFPAHDPTYSGDLTQDKKMSRCHLPRVVYHQVHDVY